MYTYSLEEDRESRKTSKSTEKFQKKTNNKNKVSLIYKFIIYI